MADRGLGRRGPAGQGSRHRVIGSRQTDRQRPGPVCRRVYCARPMRPLALVFTLALGLACARTGATAPSRGPALPCVMLWVWERPEDVRFLGGTGAGVAYLAQTLTLAGDVVQVHARQQPIRMSPGQPRMPVTRIEIARDVAPALSAAQRAEVAARITALAREANALQVDFDAPASARAFQRALLGDVRRALPPGTWLSMTALASWCQGDAWLDDTPVDEVVPMLFAMGPDAARVRDQLARRGGFDDPRCADAIGLATDEAPWCAESTRRVYLFSPAPWTRATFERALDSLPERIRHEAAR
jgi:hypothetical protein